MSAKLTPCKHGRPRGRPRLYPDIMRFFSANMTPKHIEIARLIGDGNCSKGVRISLIRCAQIGLTQQRLTSYFNRVYSYGPVEYVDRKISIRITISAEMIELAAEIAGSCSQGIRLALELYGLTSDIEGATIRGYTVGKIDAHLIKKLIIIREGLYKINE